MFDYGDPDCPWRQVLLHFFVLYSVNSYLFNAIFYIAEKIMLHT